MEEKKLKGLARLRYIFFLLKPYWKYGKAYMVVTIVMAAVFQPLSTYLATLLPQKAINAVMDGAGRREILLTIGMYTLGIALVEALQEIASLGYTRLAQQQIDLKIRNDVNKKALFSDFKYYDNPDFFTRFMYAQEEYPNHARFAMFLLPRVIPCTLPSFLRVFSPRFFR